MTGQSICFLNNAVYSLQFSICEVIIFPQQLRSLCKEYTGMLEERLIRSQTSYNYIKVNFQKEKKNSFKAKGYALNLDPPSKKFQSMNALMNFASTLTSVLRR